MERLNFCGKDLWNYSIGNLNSYTQQNVLINMAKPIVTTVSDHIMHTFQNIKQNKINPWWPDCKLGEWIIDDSRPTRPRSNRQFHTSCPYVRTFICSKIKSLQCLGCSKNKKTRYKAKLRVWWVIKFVKTHLTWVPQPKFCPRRLCSRMRPASILSGCWIGQSAVQIHPKNPPPPRFSIPLWAHLTRSLTTRKWLFYCIVLEFIVIRFITTGILI